MASDPDAVTLQDIADRAGVSLATASRVMGTGSRRVRAELVDRVQAAAAALGYQANLPARTMATGRGDTVGVLVHDIADPYFSTIAAAIVEVADRHGAVVSVGSAFADPRRELDFARMMRSMRARAVVVAGSRGSDRVAEAALGAELAAFERGGGRAVCIGQARLGVDTVAPANATGARALAAALCEIGHRRFAVLSGPPGLRTAADRLRGFRDGLRAAGITLAAGDVVPGGFDRDGGWAAAGAVLGRDGPLPDCIFAVNDVMAVGALARLREAGVSVPCDVGVAGFDDILTLRDVWPSLTTVRLPLSRIGELAGGLALERDAADRPRVLRVPGEVLLRESTTRR